VASGTAGYLQTGDRLRIKYPNGLANRCDRRGSADYENLVEKKAVTVRAPPAAEFN